MHTAAQSAPLELPTVQQTASLTEAQRDALDSLEMVLSARMRGASGDAGRVREALDDLLTLTAEEGGTVLRMAQGTDWIPAYGEGANETMRSVCDDVCAWDSYRAALGNLATTLFRLRARHALVSSSEIRAWVDGAARTACQPITAGEAEAIAAHVMEQLG